MTPAERAAFEAEMNVKPFETEAQKKRKEYIAWAASFGQDQEWVDETFTFNKDGTVEVEGDLDARDAANPFPKGLTRVGGSLFLNRLISAEGLVLPREVGGNLSLNSLTSANSLVLPREVGLDLYLNGLTSIHGLTLPKQCKGKVWVLCLSSLARLFLKLKYPFLTIKP